MPRVAGVIAVILYYFILAALIGLAVWGRGRLASSRRPEWNRLWLDIAAFVALVVLTWGPTFWVHGWRWWGSLSPTESVFYVAKKAIPLVFAWRILQQIRRAPAKAKLIKPERKPAAPSLRLQLALILVPVLGLAVGGLAAIWRDRQAVERDARAKAQELAEELAVRISQWAPIEVNEIETCGDLWAGDGFGGPETVRWPGELRYGDAIRGYNDRMTLWSNYYRLSPESVFPIGFSLETNGAFYGPLGFVGLPMPPAWFLDLTAEERTQWEAGTPSTNSNSDLNEDLAERDEDQPKTPLLMTRWRSIRDGKLARSPRDAAHRLLKLATNAINDRVETESGLPLGAAAYAAARRADPDASLDHEWFSALRDLVLAQPSMLTPWLLGEAGPMADRAHDPFAVERLATLRAHWKSAERRIAMAERFRGRVGPPYRSLMTNLWIDFGGDSWFAMARPGEATAESGTGHGKTDTREIITIKVLKKDTLGGLFVNAAQGRAFYQPGEWGTPLRLPNGLKISFTLAGRDIALPALKWTANDREAATRILAESSGQWLAVGGILGKPLMMAQDQAAREVNPRFTVRVHLADPAALFAAQRQREILFGSLILATAGVAGFGSWHAARAFGRQTALNEQKSNFVSSVSHELRAPLASMRLLSEGLATGRIQEEEKRREYAGFLVQETRRLGALVENVLDFARIEQGKKIYEFEPTDPLKLVRDTAGIVEPIAREQGVSVVCEIPDAVIAASAETAPNWDGPAIQRALLNLLDNALKHSPSGTSVTIRIGRGTAPRPAFRIEVVDQGSGIPTEDHDRIFERFYRRGSELRRETKGVGLGLTIVRHIVEGHGGRIFLQSTPGQGATFAMELPLSPVAK